MGEEKVIEALQDFDRLYPQENNESVLQQLCTQLANAVPYDLEETTLSEYKNLNPQWQDWTRVQSECLRVSMFIFENTPKQASFHLK